VIAHHVIDIGPEGGAGGTLVAQGTAGQVAKVAKATPAASWPRS